MQRHRYPTKRVRTASLVDFVNPWPWMPSTDARVKLRLDQARIPYAYRYFPQPSPQLRELLPGWAPEFVLPQLRLVIIVQGDFFGRLPTVVSQISVAQTVLAAEGWKVLVWQELDVRTRLDQLFAEEPKLASPPVRGGEIPNPYQASLMKLLDRFRLMQQKTPRFLAANSIVRERVGRRTSGVVAGRSGVGPRRRDRRYEPGGSRFRPQRKRG